MAKTNPLFVLVIVLVVAFIILLFTSCSGVAPYDNKKSGYSKYEPMATLMPTSGSELKESKAENEKKEKKDEPEAASNNGVSSVMSMFSSVLPSSSSENFEAMVGVPTSIKYGPLRDSEIIDRFSQVTANGMDGVDGCVSSGLSNSGGYLCLTPDLIQMLKTRGGNAGGN
jgi:hypothetical protein